jgi:hypothetical protein
MEQKKAIICEDNLDSNCNCASCVARSGMIGWMTTTAASPHPQDRDRPLPALRCNRAFIMPIPAVNID